MGAATIQRAQKGVKLQRKKIKIGQIFMFCHLKSWQSWQVVFSFIWMSMNSNKKSIDEILSFDLGPLKLNTYGIRQ